jgi:hypothetical protein
VGRETVGTAQPLVVAPDLVRVLPQVMVDTSGLKDWRCNQQLFLQLFLIGHFVQLTYQKSASAAQSFLRF